MKYTYGPTGYTTADRDSFIAYLMALDREGKERVLMAFWESIEVEDCCDGDNLGIISKDVIKYGGKLYEIWMNSLLEDMEDRVQYMFPDEGWTYGEITVKEVE